MTSQLSITVARTVFLLFLRATQAPIHRRAATGTINFERWATSDHRLLRGGLRYDLGFLVSHFWLLSEAFASLLFLFSPPPNPAPAGRGW